MKKPLLIIVLIVLSMQIYSQNQQATSEWRYTDKYNHIIQSGLFTQGMSDDEMAGILLSRAGRNLKLCFTFEVIGVVFGTTIVYAGRNSETVYYVASAVSLGFFIAAMCELLSGYNKISKAGIIFQHKGISVKASGPGISFNF
ncbi:MAG: hypothetical protein NTW10_00425 [Bacteroidetes bacterium]|nr:hypothetical protein [Bacteroidota bacterium]